MKPFTVWAPAARSVELVADGAKRALARGERGAWTLRDGALAHGTRYAIALDGGDPIPDPRAPRLPDGVFGPAEAVDPARFAWTDAGFRAAPLERALLYELHVGTFSPEGTFDGARERLAHLRALGVTHVELMPVASFSGARGWGYDGVGLYAPHEPYGGPAGLARFVDACHAVGLAVVIDVVYNHVGPEGDFLGRFGPYFTQRYATPWGPAVNLDGAHSDDVRAFLVDNALQWLRDYHADGLRLDAVHELVDRSAVHFLEELATAVRTLERELARPLVVIAESDLNDPRVVTERARGGYGLDAQWSDDFHHALHAAITGERAGYYADFGALADVGRALRHAYVMDGRHSAHRLRRHGRPIGDLPGTRFLGYAQSHDQIGNRARGERLIHLVGPELARVAAALVLLGPFVPMLFQGEEWGASTPFLYFASHADPALQEAVRRGRREEFASFGWSGDVPDPEAPETFEASRLRWSELGEEPHAAMLAWTRALIALRAKHPPSATEPLARAVSVELDERARWLRFERGELVVAASFAREPCRVPLPRAEARSVLASRPDVELRPGEARLPGPGVVVLERRAALSTPPARARER